jgi:hypothetical protein
MIKVVMLNILAKGGAPAGQICPNNTMELIINKKNKMDLFEMFIIVFISLLVKIMNLT